MQQSQTIRLESVESSLLFLQRDYEQLQQTVLDQYRLIEKLNSRIELLEQRLLHHDELPALPPPQEDRPPHY